MATRKLSLYDDVRQSFESWAQAECLRMGLRETTRDPALRKTIEGIELGWIETASGQYRPYHIARVHVHVETKETELNQRIEELEKAVGRLAEQLRAAMENLMGVAQPAYLGLSREQRLREARMQVARQVKLAREIGKTPADLVEDLTSLFPMSEQEADRLMRED